MAYSNKTLTMKKGTHIKQLSKSNILTLLLIVSSLLLQAQSPLVKQWDKRFGGTDLEYLSAIEATTDSGFILAGTSLSGQNGDKTQPNWSITTSNYWIVKVDMSGNKQWDKRYGGTTGEGCYAIQQTNDGGYIIGGASASDSSGDKTQNNWDLAKLTTDYWVIKVDANGNKQWDKRFGGTDVDKLAALQQTTDGGYILGGSSLSGANGDKTQPNWDLTQITPDYWIVKTDSLGNKQWDKRFGGTNLDQLTCIQQTNDGGYLLGGISGSTISGDKTQICLGGWDYWVVKTDALGNKQWDKRFGGFAEENLTSIIKTDDGSYMLSGYSFSGIGGEKTVPNHDTVSYGSDFWVIKIDSLGSQKWDKTYGAYITENAFGSMSKTVDGGFLIAGNSESDIGGDKTENNLSPTQTWIIKIDANGNKSWDKTALTYNSMDHEFGLSIQTKDGCFVIANYTSAGIGADKTQSNWDVSDSTYDYWTIKLCDTTPVSVLLPVVNLASSDTNFCEKHCIDFYDLSTNNPTSWQWFFPGSDSLTSTLQNPTNICYSTYGSFDVTLIACNAAGCQTLLLPGFINEYQIPTPTITKVNDTLFSSPGVSYQWWSVDSGIITGATNYYYLPTQDGNYFVIVTDINGCQGASNTIITGVTELTVSNGQLTITPNPNNGTFSITLPLTITKDFSIHIINPLGQTTYNKQTAISNGQQTIDVQIENAVKGLYLVEVVNGGKVYRGKFMVR
jgi:hypothetical protein